MHFNSTLGRRSVLAGLSFLTIATFLPMEQARAAGPVSISGSWAGTGVVNLEGGNKERVTCKVKYGRIAGQDFSVDARCATSGARVDQIGKLKRISNNRYVGNVHNEQFNVSARVEVRVTGTRQIVSISSAQGSANLKLKRR